MFYNRLTKPLSEKTILRRFARAIRHGKGEAMRLLKQYPEVDFSEPLLKACLNNYSYDHSYQDKRAPYLKKLLDAVLDNSVVVAGILKQLKAGMPMRTWRQQERFHQVSRLALLLIQDRYSELREPLLNIANGIYGRGEKPFWMGHTPEELYVLAELEGATSILQVARYIVGLHKKDEDLSIVGGWIDEEVYPITQSMRWPILTEAAKYDADMALFVQYVETDDTQNGIVAEKEPRKPQIIDLYIALDRIKSGEWFSREDRIEISEEQLEYLLNFIRKERNLNVRIKAIRLLAFTDLPYSLTNFYVLANKLKGTEKNRFFYAVGKIRRPEFREYAINKIKTIDDYFTYGALIDAYGLPEDLPWLWEMIKRCTKEPDRHGFFSSFIEIIKRNPCLPPFTGLLVYLYHHAHCGNCRFKLLKLMHHHHQLPKDLLEDALYDSESDTRAWAAEQMGTTPGF